MRRALFSAGMLLAFTFLAAPAFAQFTQVTATVVDPSGLPYSNGTVTAKLTPSAPGGYFLNGRPYSGFLANTNLDVNGTFVAQMGSNTSITPAGSQWDFHVCGTTPPILPPIGTGPQCFDVNITITGATQNISATLNAVAPKLSNFSGTAGNPCVTLALAFQFNNGGVFGCAPMTYTAGSNTIALVGAPIVDFSGATSVKVPVTPTEVMFASAGGAITGDSLFEWLSPDLRIQNAQNTFSGIGGQIPLSLSATGITSTSGVQALNMYAESNGVSIVSNNAFLSVVTSEFGFINSTSTSLLTSGNAPTGAYLGTVVRGGSTATWAGGIVGYLSIGTVSGADPGTTITNGTGFLSDLNLSTGPATITNLAGFWAPAPTLNPGTGITITNLFGYYSPSQVTSGATNTYGYYSADQGSAWGFYSAGASTKNVFVGTIENDVLSPNSTVCTNGSSVLTSSGCPGFSNPMTTLGDMIYGAMGGAAARLAGPTGPAGVPQTVTDTPSGGAAIAETFALPGLAARSVVDPAVSDTILATDCSPARVAYQTSASVAVTLPDATTLGVPACVFRIANMMTGNFIIVTVTPATWTLSFANTTGQTSVLIYQGQEATFSVDAAGGIWDVDIAPAFSYYPTGEDPSGFCNFGEPCGQMTDSFGDELQIAAQFLLFSYPDNGLVIINENEVAVQSGTNSACELFIPALQISCRDSSNIVFGAVGATVSIGANGDVPGILNLFGSGTGVATIQAAPAQGSPNPIQLPTATGNPGDLLQTDGGNPQQTSWFTATTIKAQACGTTTTCAATAIPNAQIIYGSVPLTSGVPSTATITGISPAFSSSSSYVCNVTEASSATGNLLKVVNVDGTSFTITGPATVSDTVNYQCIGN